MSTIWTEHEYVDLSHWDHLHDEDGNCLTSTTNEMYPKEKRSKEMTKLYYINEGKAYGPMRFKAVGYTCIVCDRVTKTMYDNYCWDWQCRSCAPERYFEYEEGMKCHVYEDQDAMGIWYAPCSKKWCQVKSPPGKDSFIPFTDFPGLSASVGIKSPIALGLAGAGYSIGDPISHPDLVAEIEEQVGEMRRQVEEMADNVPIGERKCGCGVDASGVGGKHSSYCPKGKV